VQKWRDENHGTLSATNIVMIQAITLRNKLFTFGWPVL